MFKYFNFSRATGFDGECCANQRSLLDVCSVFVDHRDCKALKYRI